MLAEDVGLPSATATKVTTRRKMAKEKELEEEEEEEETLRRLGWAILSGTEQLQWGRPSPPSQSQISLTPTIVGKCAGGGGN